MFEHGLLSQIHVQKKIILNSESAAVGNKIFQKALKGIT